MEISGPPNLTRLVENFKRHWTGEARKVEELEGVEEEEIALANASSAWGDSEENPWIFKVSKNIRSGLSELLIS